MRWLKRSGVAVLGTLAAMAILAAALYGAAQTSYGKSWIAGRIAAALSSPGETVTVTGLEGSVPFDLRIAEIQMADAAGPYLTIRDAAVTVAPGGLLRRRLDILRLAAREIVLDHTPQSEPSSTSTGTSLALPHLPVAIWLGEVKVDALRLGEALLGEAVAVSISGDGSLDRGQATADLAIDRIDGQPGRASLKFALVGSPMRLTLDAEVVEPTGRLLPDLLGRSDKLPVSLALKGDGPLAGWRGHLQASAGDKATVAADVTVMERQGYQIQAKGAAALADLLPPDIASLVGAKAGFSATMLAAENGSFSLDRLDLGLAAGTLTASGRYDPASDALAGAVHVVVPALDPLGKAIGADLAGRGAFDVTLSGTTAKPKAEIELDVGDLRYGDVKSGTTSTALTLAISDDLKKIEVAGSGHAADLASATMAQVVGQSLDWKIDGEVDRATLAATIRELSVTGPAVQLSLNGEGTPSGVAQGDLKVHIPDLGALEALTGLKLTGAADIEAKLDSSENGEASATLTGTIDRFATGIPAGDALIGSKVTFGATAKRTSDGAVTVSDVSLKGPDVQLSANATLPAPGDRISARWKLDVAKLDGLGRALGQSAKGRITLTGTAEGPLASPSVQVALDGDGLTSGAARLDRIQAKLSLSDATKATGRLDATFRSGPLEGAAGAAFEMKPNGILAVNGIKLAAGDANLTGSLALSLAKHSATGTLAGKIPDLKHWQVLVGAPLGGEADFKVSLSAAKGQVLDLTLNGKGLAYGDVVGVNRLAVTARLDDLLGKPSGHGQVDLDDIRLPQGDITRLRVTAASDKPGHFTATAEVRGQVGTPIDLTAALDATIAATDRTLRLTKLAGTVGEAKLDLHRPTVFASRKDEMSFTDFDLGFGSGNFNGNGSVGPAKLALHLQAKALPVGTLAKFGGAQDVGGILGFEITVSGTRAKPEGHLIIDGEKLQFAAASRPDLPPISVVLEGDWHEGKVGFRGRAAGPQGAALGVSGSGPLQLEPKTLEVSFPKESPISLKLEGDGEIANLADLLPLGEDRLSGQFHIDATVSGTVGKPDAGGSLTIAHGRYESLLAGSVIDAIEVELQGNRDKVQLKSFSATDGQQGRITAAGAVDLAAANGPTLDFSGKVSDFRAVRRDDATATTSGTVHLQGPLTAPKLDANVQIDRADIQLADRPSAGVGAVEVQRIDSSTGRVISDPRAPGHAAPALKVTLAVKVSIPRQVFVRGRGLDSEWQGAIQVGGTSAAPEVTGHLGTSRGTFSFSGTTFVFTQGSIDFLGGTKVDPTIDIVAQASKSDITAKIAIGGTASSPTLKLSSEPALPQDEVLARVLFGSNLSQITPAQGLEIAQTAAALAGGGGPGILDRVRSKLGLDRLGIGSNTGSAKSISLPSLGGDAAANSQSGGANGTALNAGKYVANGVYVGVSQGLSATSGQVQVQVEVTPHITIDTTLGQQSGTGVGVNWKLDY